MNACGLNCNLCPAASRCGRTCNFCLLGRRQEGCDDCRRDPIQRMEVRRALMAQLGGLELSWPEPVRHHQVGELPFHLPVLVQAYADPLDLPWVALHAGRVFGLSGCRPTPKHQRPLREVYRLSPSTKIALEFYVEDRVLEGVWTNRRAIIAELARMGFDLILAPSFSVWRNAPRFAQLVAEAMAFRSYHEMLTAGLPVVPDIGFSLFEPDGRLWAEWIDSQPDLRAVSIFCGGRKIHAERRAHRETVEDIALFHQAVRPEVTFILGGVHSPVRLAAFRQAAPGRRLVACNGMAYALAQRRRLLGTPGNPAVARSARDCFLRNCWHNDHVYAELLRGLEAA